jgi:hypothetical protein
MKRDLEPITQAARLAEVQRYILRRRKQGERSRGLQDPFVTLQDLKRKFKPSTIVEAVFDALKNE